MKLDDGVLWIKKNVNKCEAIASQINLNKELHSQRSRKETSLKF